MRTVDLIHRKRDGEELSAEEIAYVVDGYTNGTIPDYQASAFLMAVFFSGMTDREVGVLTERMMESGEKVDLSSIPGLKVDKHSTGGVGDKTSLIAAPLAAPSDTRVALSINSNPFRVFAPILPWMNSASNWHSTASLSSVRPRKSHPP